MKSVRVDKWLWAVRIFKSRTIASSACKKGKVKMDDVNLKPAQNVKVGDVLSVRVNYENRTYKVLKLIEKRVGAKIAQECYEDLTPPEEKQHTRLKSAFHMPVAYRKRGEGRPTKKDRRSIDKFKNNINE